MGSHSSIHHISTIVATYICAHVPWEWDGQARIKNSESGPIRHSCSFSVFLLSFFSFFLSRTILLPSFHPSSILLSFLPFLLFSTCSGFAARTQSNTHTLTPTRHYPSFRSSFSGGRVLPFPSIQISIDKLNHQSQPPPSSLLILLLSFPKYTISFTLPVLLTNINSCKTHLYPRPCTFFCRHSYFPPHAPRLFMRMRIFFCHCPHLNSLHSQLRQ